MNDSLRAGVLLLAVIQILLTTHIHAQLSISERDIKNDQYVYSLTGVDLGGSPNGEDGKFEEDVYDRHPGIKHFNDDGANEVTLLMQPNERQEDVSFTYRFDFSKIGRMAKSFRVSDRVTMWKQDDGVPVTAAISYSTDNKKYEPLREVIYPMEQVATDSKVEDLEVDLPKPSSVVYYKVTFTREDGVFAYDAKTQWARVTHDNLEKEGFRIEFDLVKK